MTTSVGGLVLVAMLTMLLLLLLASVTSANEVEENANTTESTVQVRTGYPKVLCYMIQSYAYCNFYKKPCSCR